MFPFLNPYLFNSKYCNIKYKTKQTWSVTFILTELIKTITAVNNSTVKVK